jgi:Chaperone of endosialidase
MTLDLNQYLNVGSVSAGLSNVNAIGLSGQNGYSVANHISGTASGTAYAYFGLGGSAIGSITQNGTTGVLYNTTSDYRVKANPVPVLDSSTRIAALKPSKWTWKRDGTPGQGFIAHEFAEVYPSSVQGKKDEMQEVEYEVTPAVPEVLDADGKVITPAIPAVTAKRTVPKYQSMMAASPEVMADIIAELQILRKRIAALEAK